MACLKDNWLRGAKSGDEKHGAVCRFRMVAGLMLRAAARKRAVKIGGQNVRRSQNEAWTEGQGSRGEVVTYLFSNC